MRIKLGAVGHFAIAVSEVKRSEKFWTENFDLKEIFRFDEGVGLSNDAVTIVQFKGEPNASYRSYVVSLEVDGRAAVCARGAQEERR